MARLTCAMLMGFEGTIGIYQGEELGQTETELVYSELTDPPALRFWPAIKGRDGCRTPMVWEADAPNAGFSTGTPWLPVKAPQAAKAVDQQDADGILAFYTEAIAFRKATPALRSGSTQFLDLPEPILAFRRDTDDQHLTCVFNLSPVPVSLTLSDSAQITGPHNATLTGQQLALPGNGFAYLQTDGALDLTM